MPAIIKSLRGKTPQIGKDCFIAENATIIGEVSIGDQCSIWYNVVMRGDVHLIQIGQRTNIQDGVIVHCTTGIGPTIVGEEVTVGHRAIIHGCTIHDRALIGMGAIVLDQAVVHSHSIVAAGAVVLAGTIVEPNCIYAGIPAKKVKVLDPQKTREQMQEMASKYVKYGGWFKEI